MKRRLFLGLAAVAIMASGIAAGVAWTQVAHAQEETTAKGFAARLATILGLEEGRCPRTRSRKPGATFRARDSRRKWTAWWRASESPRTKPMQPLNGMKSVRRVSTRAAGVLSLVSTGHAVPVPGMVFDRRRGPGSKSNFDRQRGPGSKSGFYGQRGPGSKSGFDRRCGPGSRSGFYGQRGPGPRSSFDRQRGPGTRSGFHSRRGSGPDYGLRGRGRGGASAGGQS